jgi:hypothetical protein
MTLAETLAPYRATTAPPMPADHVCPPWATECRFYDGDDFAIHTRRALTTVTRQPGLVSEAPEEVTVELYGQTNTYVGIYVDEHEHTFDQAETFALALLELVALGRAGSVPAPAQHHGTHPTTEGTTR